MLTLCWIGFECVPTHDRFYSTVQSEEKRNFFAPNHFLHFCATTATSVRDAIMVTLDYFRSHYPTAAEGVAEAVIGLTFYLSLFHGLIGFFRRKSLPENGNWNLRNNDVLEISNKLVSSTFAIFTCSCAVKGEPLAPFTTF